ncbi:hypothetical protein QP157_03490 [Sphingomonas sp. LR61]|uniref:hypothetical protein n=1 Tax=Sphingomonas sp. LR61 TaxID=3050234 RepID=UPI002FE0FA39
MWADQDRNVLSKTATYRIDPTDVRKTITVTVTGTLPGATETASVTSDATATVSQTPAFLGEDGKPTKAGADEDHPLELSTTAGDAFSHTFRAQGFPEPKYALAWFDEEDADDAAEFPEDGTTAANAGARRDSMSCRVASVADRSVRRGRRWWCLCCCTMSTICPSTFDRWRCDLILGHSGEHECVYGSERVRWNERATGHALRERTRLPR